MMRVERTALVIASAAALGACGSTSISPNRASPTPTSTASTSGTGTGAASPSSAPPSFEPLLVAFGGDARPVGMLMLATGQTTAPMPSGPIISGNATLVIAGPLGARLLGTDGQIASGPVSIVAVSSDGTVTTLEQNIAGSPSVVGRDDGQAWAWAVQTTSPACGSSSPASFDVYTDDGSGAKQIGSASFGAGVNDVTLAAWTSAGIVASGTNSCGPFGTSTLSISPAVLIDPATGAATDLAARMGTDCDFQAIADDETIACSADGSRTVRIISPQGQQSNYGVSTWASPQCKSQGVQLSVDAGFAAIPLGCPGAPTGPLVVLDLASGHGVVVTGSSNLAPTLWTPDDVLIASDFGGHKTYSVASSGTATLINATYAAQTSVG